MKKGRLRDTCVEVQKVILCRVLMPRFNVGVLSAFVTLLGCDAFARAFRAFSSLQS